MKYLKLSMKIAGNSVQAQYAIWTALFTRYVCYFLSLICSDIKSCTTDLSASLNVKLLIIM